MNFFISRNYRFIDFHLFVLILQILHPTDAFLFQNPKSRRLIEFEDVRSNAYLTGSLIKGYYGVTKRQCSLLCARVRLCRSFNFCGRQICELNQDDVFSIGIKNQNLLVERRVFSSLKTCENFGCCQN